MDAGTTTTFVVVPAIFAPEGCAVCEVAVFGARSPTGTCGEESVRTWIAPPLAPASPPASRSFAAFCGVRDAEVLFRFRVVARPPPLLKAKEVFAKDAAAAAEDDTMLPPRGGCDAMAKIQYDESPDVCPLFGGLTSSSPFDFPQVAANTTRPQPCIA